MSMFNGIDITTGAPLPGPQTLAELTSAARGEPIDAAEVQKAKLHLQATSNEHLGTVEGIDARILAQTGWGAIFASDEDPEVVEALRELLDWRKAEAGPLYQEFKGATGYKPGMTKAQFLKKADGFGPVDPKKGVPYYLLIVGSPEKIPFRFQYQVDVQYAVGRIHFDTVEEYRQYAKSVVAAEKGELTLPKRASFFGVANPGDTATEGSAKDLIQPMAAFTRGLQQGWEVDCPPPVETTRARLTQIVSDAPALVMTASHGAGVPMDHPLHLTHTGALLCQDFDGRNAANTPVSADKYFASTNVPDTARLHGSIFLLFACYGAGMPSHEDFFTGTKRAQKAKAAFVSALPKRLLAHPGGGALAVIGHVERAWSSSFEGPRSSRQLQTFESTWQRLMEGYPVGYAMEYFNIRYAELSSMLSEAIQNEAGIEDAFKPAESLELANMWQANNDARNYCVIGDPAVRIRVSDTPSGPVAMQPGSAVVVAETMEEEKQPEAFAIQSLFGSTETEPSGLADTLEKIVQRIGATLEKVVDGLTTVEVATYTSDNLANVEFKDGQFTGAKLRARTRLGMDGKTVNLVPERDGKVEETLWSVHMASVDRAIQNRSEMIKLAANAAASLLAVIRK